VKVKNYFLNDNFLRNSYVGKNFYMYKHNSKNGGSLNWKFHPLNAAIFAKASKEIKLEEIELPAWVQELEPEGISIYKGPKIEKFYISADEYQMGIMCHMVVYPSEEYDYPSFGVDWGVLTQHIFHLVEIHPLRKDEEYIKRYVEPMKNVYNKYSNLHPYKIEPKAKWSAPFRSGYGFLGMIPHEYVLDSINMIVDYFDLWLKYWREATPQEDPNLRNEARTRLQTMRQLMIEKDPGRGVLTKKYGKEIAEKMLHLMFG